MEITVNRINIMQEKFGKIKKNRYAENNASSAIGVILHLDGFNVVHVGFLYEDYGFSGRVEMTACPLARRTEKDITNQVLNNTADRRRFQDCHSRCTERCYFHHYKQK